MLIKGVVQGVGFRQFVKYEARKRGLTGWVTNTPDGKVEAVFQFPSGLRSANGNSEQESSTSSDQEGREKIEEMLALCQKGPFLAEVRDVKVQWEEREEEFETFEIIV